jgi:hypothetical protein
MFRFFSIQFRVQVVHLCSSAREWNGTCRDGPSTAAFLQELIPYSLVGGDADRREHGLGLGLPFQVSQPSWAPIYMQELLFYGPSTDRILPFW